MQPSSTNMEVSERQRHRKVFKAFTYLLARRNVNFRNLFFRNPRTTPPEYLHIAPRNLTKCLEIPRKLPEGSLKTLFNVIHNSVWIWKPIWNTFDIPSIPLGQLSSCPATLFAFMKKKTPSAPFLLNLFANSFDLTTLLVYPLSPLKILLLP